jgi:DNA-binding response OmpR family regulator
VAKKKILIVEDEAAMLKLLMIQLGAAGYEILAAMDGEEGILKARKERPDLILLDVLLPKMDGFEVCRKLKLDKDFAAIPIVMLTAKAEKMDRFFGKEVGADAYITKPFEPHQLIATIGRLLDDGA